MDGKIEKIEMMGSDSCFLKMYAVLLYNIKKATDLGLAYSDACEEAAQTVLQNIRAYSGEGELQLGWFNEESVGKISADEAKVFAHGLVLGCFFERNGISFFQKPTDGDIH